VVCFARCALCATRRASAHQPREHDAEDVHVTGTFDNWQKSIQLENKDGVFKKTVELPKTKTQYKVRLTLQLPPSPALHRPMLTKNCSLSSMATGASTRRRPRKMMAMAS
jgi:hypothetical protein